MPNDHADAALDAVLERLNTALGNKHIDGVAQLFQEDSYWRDLVLFSWNLRTLEGPEQIRDMLAQQLSQVEPVRFTRDDREAVTDEGGLLQGWLHIDTNLARGYGHIRVKDGKIWTLLTTMSELKGHEEPSGTRRPKGAEHGHQRERQTWLEKREQEAAELGYKAQPYVLIIGGGQGGIALGARLRQLDVPTIIIEKNERAGDSWRKRYKSLCLHDPVWYDHLPYIPFPDNWPVFAPKDKVGDWLGDVHQGDGTELLDLQRLPVGPLRRTEKGMGGHRAARGQARGAAAQATGAGHRHVGQAEHSALSRPGRIPGRAATLVATPGA